MGLLDKLSTGASAASSAVGAIGGISSLLFGQSQQRKAARYQQQLQMELNQQQQQFARENATTDYNRQRALIRDNASLEKQGRQAAGLSTAGDFGSGSASVSPISAPSAGSAPSMPDPNASMLAGISQIQASANSLIQNRAAMAQAEGMELQNDITKKALTEKIYGAKGEGLKAGTEGKKAAALLPTDVQKGKDEAKITNNELWKSENESAYASLNAFQSADALVQSVLQAKQNLKQAEQLYDKDSLELKLFRDTYDTRVKSVEQELTNLKKQGRAIDAQANASNAAAEDSRSHVGVNNQQSKFLSSQTLAQDIQNAVNGSPDVMAASRKRLINAAAEAGPQSFSEYAWSVINNPHATTSQKWKAAGASILGFFERTIGGASSSAGSALGERAVNGKPSNVTTITQHRGARSSRTIIKRK